MAGGRRWLVRAVLIPSVATILGCSDEPPPVPLQPVAFSHRAHAEEEIPCTRCHQGVETQAQAGLPPMSVCATCHRRRAVPDHPEVVKFMAVYDEGQPMVWRKVNVMPSSAMVHFKHKPHARAQIPCASCHGEVDQMTVAERVIDTSNMGWCLDCHRERGASIDCLTCHH